MSTKTDLNKYVVNVQGKDFITFPGLLAEAHAQGLTSVDTQLINEDLNNPVIKATVKLADKTFTGYGDANPNNVAKKVVGALLRMAETRAIARALRFACNIDMTAIEELGTDEEPVSKSVTPPAAQRTFLSPTIKVEDNKVKVEPPVGVISTQASMVHAAAAALESDKPAAEQTTPTTSFKRKFNVGK